MCKERGFTLIELLVVVLIIGILSSVALPQYQKAVDKARATEAFTGLRSLSDAANMYYLANGSYTDMNRESLDVELPESGKSFRFVLGGGNIFAPNHMDINAMDKQGRYHLTAVHYNGVRTRIYCSTGTHVEICRSLGAVSCTANAQCDLPQY